MQHVATRVLLSALVALLICFVPFSVVTLWNFGIVKFLSKLKTWYPFQNFKLHEYTSSSVSKKAYTLNFLQVARDNEYSSGVSRDNWKPIAKTFHPILRSSVF